MLHLSPGLLNPVVSMDAPSNPFTMYVYIPACMCVYIYGYMVGSYDIYCSLHSPCWVLLPAVSDLRGGRQRPLSPVQYRRCQSSSLTKRRTLANTPSLWRSVHLLHVTYECDIVEVMVGINSRQLIPPPPPPPLTLPRYNFVSP